MACALTAGYTQDCRDSVGGAKKIKIIEKANVDGFTVTSNVITAVDNATSKRWWSYTPARDTASATSTGNYNVPNGTGFYVQEVKMALNKMQTATRVELHKVAQNTLYIAVQDANDKYWLYGYKNGMDLTGNVSGTGGAPGDRNGYDITFTGAEPEDTIEIDAATWATLETPGS